MTMISTILMHALKYEKIVTLITLYPSY